MACRSVFYTIQKPRHLIIRVNIVVPHSTTPYRVRVTRATRKTLYPRKCPPAVRFNHQEEASTIPVTRTRTRSTEPASYNTWDITAVVPDWRAADTAQKPQYALDS